jgi:hypothetical protein
MDAQELDDLLTHIESKDSLSQVSVVVRDVGELGFSQDLSVTLAWFNVVTGTIVLETD